MDTTLDEQRIIDNEHLRMLRIGYFISGATAGLFVCLGLFYMAMGMTFGGFMDSIPTAPGEPSFDSTKFPLGFFVVVGAVVALIGAAITTLRLYTARCLGRRKSLWFCHLTAALSCLDIPWGTALGVLTFLLLSRPSVRAMFEGVAQE